MNNQYKTLQESLKIRHELWGMGYVPIADEIGDFITNKAKLIGWKLIGKAQKVRNQIDKAARYTGAKADLQKKDVIITHIEHEGTTAVGEFLIKNKNEILVVSAILSLSLVGLAIRSIYKGIDKKAKNMCKRGRTVISPNGKSFFEECVKEEKKKALGNLIKQLNNTKNKLFSLPKKYKDKAIVRINKYIDILNKKIKRLTK